MDGSAVRFVIAVVFNLTVAVGLHFLGMSTTTAWLTFLAFCGFAALAEIGMQLSSVQEKLDVITRREQQDQASV
jgi:hypothetical protein